MKVELFIDVPLTLARRLNKAALRGRGVRIDGANWPKARAYCSRSCGWTEAV